MSKGAIIAIVTVGVLAVGGGGFYLYRRRKNAAPAVEITAGLSPQPMPPPLPRVKGKRTVGSIIARLGGKAVREGAKLAIVGPQAYAASVAVKAAKKV